MKKLTKLAPERVKQAELYRLIAYCLRDVEVESAIAELLPPLSRQEEGYYWLDQKINERGCLIDRALVLGARAIRDVALSHANGRVGTLTNGQVKTISQTAALTRWLRESGLPDLEKLDKYTLAEIETGDLPNCAGEVVTIRRDTAKSSVAKYDAMNEYADEHDVMRGLLQYHGSATGRWAGRGPQMQNLPRQAYDPAPFLDVITNGDYDTLNILINPLDALSTAVRAALIARPGRRLVVADYNAIEARVLAWGAKETKLLEAFRNREDPYVRMASAIYAVEPGKVTKLQRLLGKIAVLGLGYQMGVTKFANTCESWGVPISFDQATDAVQIYRRTNAQIRSFWFELQDGAFQAVLKKTRVVTVRNVIFECRDEHWLTMQLPSGRQLFYRDPKATVKVAGITRKGGMVEAAGVDSMTHRWARYRLYGGILVENWVQAVARDLLAAAMARAEGCGYPVILTVHDEIISEPVTDFGSVEEFVRILCVSPNWAAGCPITAEGWEGTRYHK